ncbi:hypothetical protein ACHWQZ_G013308 [Mnemiopsis leidyi]
MLEKLERITWIYGNPAYLPLSWNLDLTSTSTLVIKTSKTIKKRVNLRKQSSRSCRCWKKDREENLNLRKPRKSSLVLESEPDFFSDCRSCRNVKKRILTGTARSVILRHPIKITIVDNNPSSTDVIQFWRARGKRGSK